MVGRSRGPACTDRGASSIPRLATRQRFGETRVTSESSRTLSYGPCEHCLSRRAINVYDLCLDRNTTCDTSLLIPTDDNGASAQASNPLELALTPVEFSIKLPTCRCNKSRKSSWSLV